ncbi:hypothetical protein J4414_00605 [Candidatus Woesearchaeota archaeon]|nr:hypothetical protein [Candidatus Woesearchaeota archaeon]
MKRQKTETRVYPLVNGVLLVNGCTGKIQKDKRTAREVNIFYGNDGRFIAVNHEKVVYGVDEKVLGELDTDDRARGELEFISEEEDSTQRAHYVDSFCDVRAERSLQIQYALKEAEKPEEIKAKDLLQLQEVSDIVNGKPKGRMLEERFNEKSLPRGMRIRNRLYLK